MTESSPNGHTRFVFGNRYLWVEADEASGIDGFRAEVRCNLPNGELRAFLDQIAHMDRKRADVFYEQVFELKRLDEERRDIIREGDRAQLDANLAAAETVREQMNGKLSALDRETWGLVAPLVRDWNAYYEEDGKVLKTPPPADDPAKTFDLTEGPVITWLIETISTAYRSGKGVRPPSRKPGDSLEPLPEQSSGPQMAAE